MEKPLWVWIVFIAIILTLLVFDLGIFNKDKKEIDAKTSIKLSLYYIFVAFLFGKWVWYYMGAESAKEYYTGFLVEKTLAVDNIFVISMIFTYFKIPNIYQHRVLFWGIIGVIILRAIMIALGATLITNFGWVMYIFAVFLIITGIKMIVLSDQKLDLENNFLLKMIKKYLPVTDQLHGEKFVFYDEAKKKRYFTPLFIALCMIEFVDLIFAVDSVPAIFAITNDVYIVYTSNIFAILGLRALYFALAAIIDRFHYLKFSVSIILILIGFKIVYSEIYGKIAPIYSLSVTAILILCGILLSIYKTKKN